MSERDGDTALIRASALVEFDDFVRRRGHDPHRLMDMAGLSPVYLREPDLYLPYQGFVKLLDLSARETDNPFLGAEFGLEQGMRVIGPTAYLFSSSATLEEALEGMFSNYNLHTSGALVQLRRFGDKVMLQYEVIVSTPHNVRQVLDNACAIGLRLMKTALGSNWKPDELHLQHDVRAEYRRRYSQLFGLNPQFDREYTGWIFEAAALRTTLPEADPALHELVERQLSVMQDQYAEDLPQRVKAMIRELMPTSEVSLNAIARLMAMSPRSLQRHLKTHGTSFQELVDDARRQVAEHYLRHTGLQLTQIADLLGFKCLSNFSHAFQRWHGVSPRQWKKSLV